MLLRRLMIAYGTAMLVFLAIDAVWLGVLALQFYKDQIGHLLAPRPNFAAAGVFYLTFIAGLLVFGVRPGAPDRSLGGVALLGGLYGFFTYATYDLTSMATLPNWPALVVVVDLAWGAGLCAVVATVTFAVERWALGE